MSEDRTPYHDWSRRAEGMGEWWECAKCGTRASNPSPLSRCAVDNERNSALLYAAEVEAERVSAFGPRTTSTEHSECVCGDGEGVGFCFGVPTYTDECKACLALPSDAPCLGHDTNGATS